MNAEHGIRAYAFSELDTILKAVEGIRNYWVGVNYLFSFPFPSQYKSFIGAEHLQTTIIIVVLVGRPSYKPSVSYFDSSNLPFDLPTSTSLNGL